VFTNLSNGIWPTFALPMIEPINEFFFKTPWHGAQTPLYCILDEFLGKLSGGICYSDRNIFLFSEQRMKVESTMRSAKSHQLVIMPLAKTIKTDSWILA
jgi:hypothetical protein